MQFKWCTKGNTQGLKTLVVGLTLPVAPFLYVNITILTPCSDENREEINGFARLKAYHVFFFYSVASALPAVMYAFNVDSEDSAIYYHCRIVWRATLLLEGRENIWEPFTIFFYYCRFETMSRAVWILTAYYTTIQPFAQKAVTPL